jgi:transposase InsO family protein
MRRQGIRAVTQRRFRACTTDSHHDLPIAPNRLDQKFAAERPNQVWLADITYVPTGDGWLYLAVVLDLFTPEALPEPATAVELAQTAMKSTPIKSTPRRSACWNMRRGRSIRT